MSKKRKRVESSDSSDEEEYKPVRKRRKRKRKCKTRKCGKCKKITKSVITFKPGHFENNEVVQFNHLCNGDHPGVLCDECHILIHGCTLCKKEMPTCYNIGSLCADCEFLTGWLFKNDSVLKGTIKQKIKERKNEWLKELDRYYDSYNVL